MKSKLADLCYLDIIEAPYMRRSTVMREPAPCDEPSRDDCGDVHIALKDHRSGADHLYCFPGHHEVTVTNPDRRGRGRPRRAKARYRHPHRLGEEA